MEGIKVTSQAGHNIVITLPDGTTAVFVPGDQAAIEVAKRIESGPESIEHPDLEDGLVIPLPDGVGREELRFERDGSMECFVLYRDGEAVRGPEGRRMLTEHEERFVRGAYATGLAAREELVARFRP